MSLWFFIGMYLAIRGGDQMDEGLTFSPDFWLGVVMMAVGIAIAQNAIERFVKGSSL